MKTQSYFEKTTKRIQKDRKEEQHPFGVKFSRLGGPVVKNAADDDADNGVADDSRKSNTSIPTLALETAFGAEFDLHGY